MPILKVYSIENKDFLNGELLQTTSHNTSEKEPPIVGSINCEFEVEPFRRLKNFVFSIDLARYYLYSRYYKFPNFHIPR